MPRRARKRKKTEESTSANEILQFIKDNPGVHFKKMQKELDFSFGTLQYHLNRMEQNEEVVVLRMKYHTRYFHPTLEDTVDRKLLMLLRQAIPRKLILILIEQPEKTGHELTKLLKITKSTLSYYTKRLEKMDILKASKHGREKHFSVSKPERIARLLVEHKSSFKDEMVDRFVDLWVRV